ncbi:MAG: aquaporin [Verrucomicrobiota bacterium]
MRSFVAEFIATFALVFVGVVSIHHNTGEGASILVPAFAHGLIVAVMIFALGSVSGAHINPAVTVALLADGKIGGAKAGGYIVSQLLGATIAALLVWIIYDMGAVEAGAAVLMDPTMPYWKAFLLEFIGTFFLMTVIYGVAVAPKEAIPAAGLAIGLTVTACIFLAGPSTGAAFNPARAFGPALVTGYYSTEFVNQSVYWVGPILGAVAATLLYGKVLRNPEVETTSARESYQAAKGEPSTK